MLNSIVTIIVLPLSRLSCFGFSKSLKSLDKRPSKKGLPRDSSGGHGGIYA